MKRKEKERREDNNMKGDKRVILSSIQKMLRDCRDDHDV